jgi:hypothetical protein
VFVMCVSLAQGEFNSVCDGDGVWGVDGSQVDGCFELKSMGKVTRFNLFYES